MGRGSRFVHLGVAWAIAGVLVAGFVGAPAHAQSPPSPGAPSLRADPAPAHRSPAALVPRGARWRNDCAPGRPGPQSPVCVWWVSTGSDAPRATDRRPRNGIPDQVDRTRATVRHVLEMQTGTLGYRRPLRDTGHDTLRPDLDPRPDVFVADLGVDSTYGYCSATRARRADSPHETAMWCAFDNDYAARQYPSAHTPLQLLHVTVAHEMFHTVQAAYDSAEDRWLVEGTAAWMEEIVYPRVHDNEQYLRDSPLTDPARPLDASNPSTAAVYGSWILWRQLAAAYGVDVVRRVWEAAGDADPRHPGTYSIAALDAVLATEGDTTAVALGALAVAARHPADVWPRGDRYPTAPLVGPVEALTPARPEAGGALTLDHLTTATVRIEPGPGFVALRLTLDLPTSAVAIVRTDQGEEVVVTPSIGSDPVVTDLPLTGSVSAVEVTLVNGGTRYACNRGVWFACRGQSLDDASTMTWSVSAS